MTIYTFSKYKETDLLSQWSEYKIHLWFSKNEHIYYMVYHLYNVCAKSSTTEETVKFRSSRNGIRQCSNEDTIPFVLGALLLICLLQDVTYIVARKS